MKENLPHIYGMMKEEIKHSVEHPSSGHGSERVSVSPFLDDSNSLTLTVSYWEIVLRADGTWSWHYTFGG